MTRFSVSDGSQEAFELYYSETYSESSSVSPQDSHRSLASVSDGGDSNPALLLMQEYMITVSVDRLLAGAVPSVIITCPFAEVIHFNLTVSNAKLLIIIE